MSVLLVSDDDAVHPDAEPPGGLQPARVRFLMAFTAAMLATAGADLELALATEARTQAEAGATADHREAVEAFVTKRKAVFSGP